MIVKIPNDKWGEIAPFIVPYLSRMPLERRRSVPKVTIIIFELFNSLQSSLYLNQKINYLIINCTSFNFAGDITFAPT